MDSVRIDRVPPQNMDAERAVLGALMQIGDAETDTLEVLDILLPDMFYREAHKQIYLAIRENSDKGVPNDLITVTEKLEHLGKLEQVGGVNYLSELLDSTIPANAKYYADIVIGEYQRRYIIYASAQSYNEAFDKTIEVTDVISYAEQRIMGVKGNENSNGLTTIHESMKEAFKHVQDIYNRPETLLGVPSGFKDLDKMTSGFNKSDLIIVAGRPGMGKSTLVQDIAQYVAIEKGDAVAIFTLESASMLFALRMLSCISGIDFNHIRTGQISETMWGKLTVSAGAISYAPIYLDETPSITPRNLRSKLYQIKRKADVKLVIVDYLQLMTPDVICGNREQEVSSVSRSLKAIAKEFGVPVIACAQLSRKSEERNDKRPQLADLRESGGIEQDADLVIMLYREQYYNKECQDSSIELLIEKQRNGPTGKVTLGYSGSHFKFYDLP